MAAEAASYQEAVLAPGPDEDGDGNGRRKLVGSSDRCNEAVGMVALHEALRSVCLKSEWTYSIFWTIRPRLRLRGGGGCTFGDDNGSLMLVWEDGFCRGRVAEVWMRRILPGKLSAKFQFSCIIMEKG